MRIGGKGVLDYVQEALNLKPKIPQKPESSGVGWLVAFAVLYALADKGRD